MPDNDSPSHIGISDSTIKQLAIALTLIATLGTTIYNGCQNQKQMATQEQTKDIAAKTIEAVANQTADPVAVKTSAELDKK